MPIYRYTGRDKNGKLIEGTEEASGENEAARTLQGRGILVTKISNTIALGQRAAAAQKTLKKRRHRRVKQEDLLFFVREMGVLIDAGVTVVRALDLISEQIRSERLFKILEAIKGDIRAGMTLKDAFAQHPKAFPRVWVSLIEAGETSGHLSAVLTQMAIHLEASINLNKKIISALIYPSVLICASIGAVLIFMLKIIPIFADLFKSFNAELPLLTRVLMIMSDFLRQNTLYFFVMMAVAFYFFKRWTASAQGRAVIDRLMLRLPVVGPFVSDTVIARISMNMATLLQSGVNILLAIEVCSDVAGNSLFRDAFRGISHEIRQGKTFSACLQGNLLFPPFMVQMAVIGEESGKLPAMMSRAAEYYTDRVDVFVGRLGVVIEPAILLFVGGIIGILAVAMFLPLIRMSAAIR